MEEQALAFALKIANHIGHPVAVAVFSLVIAASVFLVALRARKPAQVLASIVAAGITRGLSRSGGCPATRPVPGRDCSSEILKRRRAQDGRRWMATRHSAASPAGRRQNNTVCFREG